MPYNESSARTAINPDILVTVCAVVNGGGTDLAAFAERMTLALSEAYRYYELLLIDNGSPPEIGLQVQAIQRCTPNVRLIRLSRAYGAEVALAAALDNSIGDYVVVMSMETDPPALVPELVARAVAGFDVVIAEPMACPEPFLYRMISNAFYRSASRLL